MRSCLGNGPPPDLVLAHAPGTQQGDTSEWTALESVFGSSPPPVYSNKWLMGHTLGAAGALNVALALALLGRTEIPQLPYPHQLAAAARASPPLRRLMINAVGFGGVAASVMIESLD
jgi:3-oxoacyl-(acyl-carrier-protein) synthase